MIKRLAAELFCASAASHVKAVRGEAGAERGLCQAPGIARVARTFQAVDQNDLATRFAGRLLGMNQHFDARFSLVQARLHRETLLV
jgi:hypothetical protein